MFIGRNLDGSIYGLWTCRQWIKQEELPDDNAEVLAFINRPEPTPKPTLADKLVEKGVLTQAEADALK